MVHRRSVVQKDPSRRFRVQDEQSVDEIVELLLDGPRALDQPSAGGATDWRIDRALIAREIGRARAEQTLVRFECECPGPDNWIEVLAHPDPGGLAISVWDITDRK